MKKKFDLEDQPARTGMLRKYWSHRRRKCPADNYLRSFVGKRWNDCYSRLCNPPKGKEPMYARIRELLRDDEMGYFVAFDVEMVDGEPVRRSGTRWFSFYVLDGILCEKKYKKHKSTYNRAPLRSFNWKKIDGKCYFELKGIYYEITFKFFTEREHFDLLFGVFFSKQDALMSYGAEIYAAEKHQLSSREKKKLGL